MKKYIIIGICIAVFLVVMVILSTIRTSDCYSLCEWTGTSWQITSNISLVASIPIAILGAYLYDKIRKMQKKIKDLTELYTVRTLMFNLSDILSGKSGKILPTEENLQIGIDALSKNYMDKYDTWEPEVEEIYNLIKDHKSHTTREPSKCTVCKPALAKIDHFIRTYRNPIQELFKRPNDPAM